jgi:Na+/melibiose symporter-like transporter
MRAISHALRQRGLRLMLGAGLISASGDWVLRIGLTYYVYALTGSTLASAAMLLASFVPQIALGSLAGVFVDRWDSKRTMIGANLLLAAGLLPLLAVHHAGQVWIVYAVTAWEGCVQQFFFPAQQSMLPALTIDEHLTTANALNGQASDVSRLAGSAAGGVIAAAGGIIALALTDAASFLLAAVLIARISASDRMRGSGTAGPGDKAGARLPGPLGQAGRGAAARLRGRLAEVRARIAELRGEWAGGLRACTGSRVLLVVLVFLLVTSVGEGIMGTLFAPFVRSVLHGSGADYGFIVAVQAIGGICGGLVAAAIGSRLSAQAMLGWGAVAFGAIDLLMFLYPLGWVAIWPAAVCMVVVGVPGAFMLAGALTLVQRGTADGQRGRVFGALSAAEGAAAVAGTVAAGLLGQHVGIIPVLAVQGGGYLAAGLLVVLMLRAGSLTMKESVSLTQVGVQTSVSN